MADYTSVAEDIYQLGFIIKFLFGGKGFKKKVEKTQQPSIHVQLLHFIGEKIKAQRGEVTCLRAHSLLAHLWLEGALRAKKAFLLSLLGDTELPGRKDSGSRP